MHTAALKWLQCPFCLGEISATKVVEGSADAIRAGLLQCSGCSFEFPVIANVLILMGADETLDVMSETTARTVERGPRVRALIDLLKRDQPIEALSALLAPTAAKGRLFPTLGVPDRTADAAPAHHRPLPVAYDDLPFRERATRRVAERFRGRLQPRAQHRLAQFLEAHRDRLTALDVLDLYYRQYSGVETFNYFAFRFGQPRHLAGLALATLVERTRGPVLDLACGVGHVTHYFASAYPQRPVFGLDRDFFRLYVASQSMAPSATFICAPADRALPFAAGSLGAVFCSDAYHYFLNRAASVRELERQLGDDGLLMLFRFGNKEVNPREGYELTVDGYARLFGSWPHRVLGEQRLVDDYLHMRGPDLNADEPLDALRREKWLSIVASRRLDSFAPSQPFTSWPHAAGRLRVNPIYLSSETADGGRDLRFEFPSRWYEFENGQYAEYAPPNVHLSPAALRALASGQATPELEALVKQFVVLGLPDRYA